MQAMSLGVSVTGYNFHLKLKKIRKAKVEQVHDYYSVISFIWFRKGKIRSI